VEKYSRARQATDDGMANARISFWIPKATNTHSQYAILIAFHCNNGCTNASEGYVMRTVPVSLSLKLILPYFIEDSRTANLQLIGSPGYFRKYFNTGQDS